MFDYLLPRPSFVIEGLAMSKMPLLHDISNCTIAWHAKLNKHRPTALAFPSKIGINLKPAA